MIELFSDTNHLQSAAERLALLAVICTAASNTRATGLQLLRREELVEVTVLADDPADIEDLAWALEEENIAINERGSGRVGGSPFLVVVI